MWLGGVWSRCGLFEDGEGLKGGMKLDREREREMIVLLYDELIVESVYPCHTSPLE